MPPFDPMYGDLPGIVEAAIARGWWPPDCEDREPGDDEQLRDWESLRLAAICRLFIQTRDLDPGA